MIVETEDAGSNSGALENEGCLEADWQRIRQHILVAEQEAQRLLREGFLLLGHLRARDAQHLRRRASAHPAKLRSVQS